jgi:hypothetical protein
MITGMGDFAIKMGMPTMIATVLDAMTIIVYTLALIELKTGRAET